MQVAIHVVKAGKTSSREWQSAMAVYALPQLRPIFMMQRLCSLQG